MGLSFRTLQRGNAVRDALRHKSAPHRKRKTGRGASRTACDAEHRTMAEELRHDSWDYRSARSSVGMPFVTLCVTSLRRTANARPDAERPERHTHAEHGYDGVLERTYRSPTRSIGTIVVRLPAAINGTGQPRYAVLSPTHSAPER
ncbi:DUF1534 domain-containing protein [Pseudomonas savastanoi]|nr:DUF1534 domain-containing protein [Pseudomonas amygdali pv. tabaci str. ATCC 11528]QOI02486.1 DUF1534 domain-containing protein [Pseudomonas savastanoi]